MCTVQALAWDPPCLESHLLQQWLRAVGAEALETGIVAMSEDSHLCGRDYFHVIYPIREFMGEPYVSLCRHRPGVVNHFRKQKFASACQEGSHGPDAKSEPKEALVSPAGSATEKNGRAIA